jgi:hypothetical protein
LSGGGRHGHSGLLMTAQEYESVYATPFAVALDPGPIVIVDFGTEAVEAASGMRLHDELKRIYIRCINCDESCKKLIWASYANMFTDALNMN